MVSNYLQVLRGLRFVGSQYKVGALLRSGCKSYMILPSMKSSEPRTLLLNVPVPRIAEFLSLELADEPVKKKTLEIFRENEFEVDNVMVITPAVVSIIIQMQVDGLLAGLDF